MAVIIVIIDRGVDTICQISMTGRIIRIVCILGVAIFVFMDSWNAAHTRKTNMDVLAVKLEVLSAKDDLIVVWPFYLGISFARYYKGSSEWVTLPKIADNSVQRYDLFKLKMMETEPIKDVLQKMVRTLQNGHRVWFVGEVDFLSAGEMPGMLPPAPHSPYGWSGAVYQRVWSDTAAFTLQTHGQTFKAIEIPVVDPVNKFENVPLMVVQGWRP